MEITEVSNLLAQFSVQKLLEGDVSLLLSLMYLVISLAIYSILIWYFYRFIAQRDCFCIKQSAHPCLKGFLDYFMIFPFVATLFFTGFALILIFLTKNYEIPELLATSFALVVAIRLTAYYSEDLSKDVAKMLPFAVLGLVLVNPTFFNIEDILGTFDVLPEFFMLALQFVLLIVFIEWGLRIGLFVKHLVFSGSRVKSSRSTNLTSS